LPGLFEFWRIPALYQSGAAFAGDRFDCETSALGVWAEYWAVVSDERVVASYKVTLWAALFASVFNGVVRLVYVAWVSGALRVLGQAHRSTL